jgi:hypothetical protein
MRLFEQAFKKEKCMRISGISVVLSLLIAFSLFPSQAELSPEWNYVAVPDGWYSVFEQNTAQIVDAINKATKGEIILELMPKTEKRWYANNDRGDVDKDEAIPPKFNIHDQEVYLVSLTVPGKVRKNYSYSISLGNETLPVLKGDEGNSRECIEANLCGIIVGILNQANKSFPGLIKAQCGPQDAASTSCGGRKALKINVTTNY